MKTQIVKIVGLLWLSLEIISKASLASDEFVSVSTTRQDEHIHINASFKLPLSHCEAYRYLTDNSSQNAIPGVIHARTKRISTNKVQIDRRVEEHVLFIPIHLDSLIEVTELPFKGTDFVQLSGSARSYKGTWRLEPTGDSTLFVFNGITDPGTMMPGFLVEHYMNKNLRANFEAVAKIGMNRKGVIVEGCQI